jgi:hypothetical protein
MSNLMSYKGKALSPMKVKARIKELKRKNRKLKKKLRAALGALKR